MVVPYFQLKRCSFLSKLCTFPFKWLPLSKIILYIRFQNSPIFSLQNELQCTFPKNHEGIFSLSFLFTLLNYGFVNSKRAHPPPPGHLSFCFGKAANAPRWGLKVRCKCLTLPGFCDIRNNHVIAFKFMNLGMRGSCERPLQQTFSPNFKHCSGMKFTTHATSKLETAHSGQTTEYHWQYRTG